ncbi:hypothetical protein [Actinoplanes sp. NPDC026619]|uniref:hypothetical protein n=1 Tax=Actinoplanes sp. NPDC026619 TaxID=3155798 RepID=UPI0033E0D808
MTRQELAEAINAYAWEVHGKRKGYDRSHIAKYEQGIYRWPGVLAREGFRHVLRVNRDSELGFYPNRMRNDPVNEFTATRETSQQTKFETPGFVRQDLQAGPTLDDVDLVEFVTAFEGQTGEFSRELTAAELTAERLDRNFARNPPGETFNLVRTLMSGVLKELRTPHSLGHQRRLTVLAARLAGLRAWASFDMDSHRAAEWWYQVAGSAAEESEAWSLCAWLHGAQSLIPWHRRDMKATTALLEKGLHFAADGSDATIRAWLFAMYARSLAGLGDRERFADALRLAQENAEYSSDRDGRHGMDFEHGTLDLRYYAGVSRLMLGDTDKAEVELHGSLATLPETHIKARGVLTLFIADAAVQSGDICRAVDLTSAALSATEDQPIMPVLQQSRRVRRLVRQRDDAAAEQLDPYIEEFSRRLTALGTAPQC